MNEHRLVSIEQNPICGSVKAAEAVRLVSWLF